MTAGSFLVALALLPAAFAPALAGAKSVHGRASGAFDVELVPEPRSAGGPEARMMLRKRFSGDLTGTSTGEMLTSGTASSSGAYVAIERIAAGLAGRDGSFALVHRGIMDGGRADLSVTVVPGSGTGRLAGLAGTMTIGVEGGRHFYTFEYDLPGNE